MATRISSTILNTPLGEILVKYTPNIQCCIFFISLGRHMLLYNSIRNDLLNHLQLYTNDLLILNFRHNREKIFWNKVLGFYNKVRYALLTILNTQLILKKNKIKHWRFDDKVRCTHSPWRIIRKLKGW